MKVTLKSRSEKAKVAADLRHALAEAEEGFYAEEAGGHRAGRPVEYLLAGWNPKYGDLTG